MKRTILAAVLLAGTAMINSASADITQKLADITSDHLCSEVTGTFDGNHRRCRSPECVYRRHDDLDATQRQ